MSFSLRVRKLQEHLGVGADGIIGNETLTAIERELFGHDSSSLSTISFRDRLVFIACAETGTKEVGDNGGDRVREYQAATWLEPSAWPWCAAFICWIVREAMSDSEKFTRPRTAGAWDFENWARGKHGVVPGVRLIKPAAGVKAGDIVVFTFSHIGVATADSTGNSVLTVEGNTNAAGSREGDGVWAKTRKLSQIRSIIRFD